VALLLALPLAHAHAQVSNAPLHPSQAAFPSQPAYSPYPQYPLAPAATRWPSGMHGGSFEGSGLAMPGVADRYPSDRSPSIDNRAPTLRPAGPDLRDTTLRLGSPLDNAVHTAPVRRPDGLQAPLSAGEPVRRGLRY
jgi:hypothetical protein